MKENDCMVDYLYKTYLIDCLFKDIEDNFEYGIMTKEQFENQLLTKKCIVE